MKTLSLLSTAALGSLLIATAASADPAAGKEIFGQRCATCHGPTGLGDGPVGMALPPEMRPRNLAEGAFKVVKDQATFKDLMLKGGSGVGLNPLMPPQPDLNDAQVASLFEFINSLKKK